MASLNMNFDASTVQPTSSYDPLPNGEYLVVAVASDMKTSSKSGGQYLEIELEVLDGNFKGRKLWDRINLVNSSAKTVEIAQRQLSSLCHATGVLNVTDSAQLHNIPVIATIKYKDPQNGYGASNEVRGYKKANDSATPQAPQQQAAPVTRESTQTAGATPPWGRK